jgi:hypothetical protein
MTSLPSVEEGLNAKSVNNNRSAVSVWSTARGNQKEQQAKDHFTSPAVVLAVGAKQSATVAAAGAVAFSKTLETKRTPDFATAAIVSRTSGCLSDDEFEFIAQPALKDRPDPIVRQEPQVDIKTEDVSKKLAADTTIAGAVDTKICADSFLNNTTACALLHGLLNTISTKNGMWLTIPCPGQPGLLLNRTLITVPRWVAAEVISPTNMVAFLGDDRWGRRNRAYEFRADTSSMAIYNKSRGSLWQSALGLKLMELMIASRAKLTELNKVDAKSGVRMCRQVLLLLDVAAHGHFAAWASALEQPAVQQCLNMILDCDTVAESKPLDKRPPSYLAIAQPVGNPMQLYLAASCADHFDSIKAFLSGDKTTSICAKPDF